MNKREQLKLIAENILDKNTPVYEKDVLKYFKYKAGCDIVTIRIDIRLLKIENVNIKSIIKILENNLEAI